MYIVIRTIEVADGANVAEAVQAAAGMTEYLKTRQNLDARLAINVGGYLHHIHWIVMTDSLDAGPARDAERAADPEWQGLVAAAIEAGLFKPGSIRDKILQVVA